MNEKIIEIERNIHRLEEYSSHEYIEPEAVVVVSCRNRCFSK